MTHNLVYKLFCKEVQLRKDLVLILIRSRIELIIESSRFSRYTNFNIIFKVTASHKGRGE